MSDLKKYSALLLFICLILNILSAVFTEIMSDEAYYSLYGENLAWGYYDHPPMVGLMTHLSALLFNGNLSVRFMTVVMQLLTLIIVLKLTEEKRANREKISLFFIIAASLVMFQAYGFITTPDISLLFFTSIFLCFYRSFTKNETWISTFGMAFSMSAMIYSKYHAVLVIMLILLSNLRLLTKPKAWIALFSAIVLLLPHLLWHIEMNFPAFRYHLNERSAAFRWSFFWEYIPNQLVVFNPAVFIGLIYIFIKRRAKDVFERGLYFLSLGVLCFFWIMSFRGHVEPHWTVVCSIPAIILTYRYCLENAKFKRIIKPCCVVFAALVIIARIILTTDLLPQRLDFHGKEAKYKAIASVAGNLPVVFTGSFQNPSNYHFFTKNESFVLSAVDGRQTQFDIWQKELEYQGKTVFINGSRAGLSKKYSINNFEFEGYFVEHFQSVNRVEIKYQLPANQVKSGDFIEVPFEIYNPAKDKIYFNHPELPVDLKAVFAENRKRGQIIYADVLLETPIDTLSAGESLHNILTTQIPDLPFKDCKFALSLCNPICHAKNSNLSPLEIIIQN